MEWCHSILSELGFSNIELKDVFPSGQRQHCQAYLQLRDRIRQHMASDAQPVLEETKPPAQEHGFHPDLDDIVSDLRSERASVEEVDYYLDI